MTFNSGRRSSFKKMLVGGASLGTLISFKSKNSMPVELKGNINHGVCHWCFRDYSLDDFCAEAKKIGLIDEIYSIETVEQKATEKAVELSGFQAHAFSAVKSCRTEEIRDRYEKNFKSQNEIFLDCWFSESTQRILKDASQKF